ncbi:Phage integrase family protein, partial [Dysosmobacter welbionis]
SLFLGQSLEVAEKNGHPLLLRQLIDGLPQGDPLHHALLRGVRAQHPLQGEAVCGLPLEGLRRVRGDLHLGDLLRRQAGGLGELAEHRLPAQLLPQPLPNGVKCLSLLPHGAPHFYRAVVPEKATNLPGDFGHGVGGEAGAVVKVESLHRLQKPQAPQLVQVLRVHAPAVIPPHHAPDQAVVLNHRLLAGIPVPLLGRPQQLQRGAHFVPCIRGASRLRITTVVPRPGVERT